MYLLLEKIDTSQWTWKFTDIVICAINLQKLITARKEILCLQNIFEKVLFSLKDLLGEFQYQSWEISLLLQNPVFLSIIKEYII